MIETLQRNRSSWLPRRGKWTLCVNRTGVVRSLRLVGETSTPSVRPTCRRVTQSTYLLCEGQLAVFPRFLQSQVVQLDGIAEQLAAVDVRRGGRRGRLI